MKKKVKTSKAYRIGEFKGATYLMRGFDGVKDGDELEGFVKVIHKICGDIIKKAPRKKRGIK